jgi:cytochrome oxidase Cu insertion factor (SCO1/SenC/PrrC family)
MRGAALAGLALVAAVAAAERRLDKVDPAELTYTYGVGGFTADYVPPPAGTYTLPPIDTVADHALLDSDGHRTSLFALKKDRLAVVAFVYTTCIDATGCPLGLALLQRLDGALAADAALARRITLIAISFDPERDTPARLATVRALHQPKTDWRFATTGSEAELRPLLTDFDQPVAKLRFADGEWTGLYRHVLKVFLLDRSNRVRNVYSTGFLNPALVLNDLRTVLAEAAG